MPSRSRTHRRAWRRPRRPGWRPSPFRTWCPCPRGRAVAWSRPWRLWDRTIFGRPYPNRDVCSPPRPFSGRTSRTMVKVAARTGRHLSRRPRPTRPAALHDEVNDLRLSRSSGRGLPARALAGVGVAALALSLAACAESGRDEGDTAAATRRRPAAAPSSSVRRPTPSCSTRPSPATARPSASPGRSSRACSAPSPAAPTRRPLLAESWDDHRGRPELHLRPARRA